MDISNDKQAKSHTRRLGHGQERETLREKLNLLIAAQNNVKAKIDKMQQNSKCRFCSDGDKTINYIMSECS